MLKLVPLLLLPLIFAAISYKTRWKWISIAFCVFFYSLGILIYVKSSDLIGQHEFQGIVNEVTYRRNEAPSITVDGIIYKNIPVQFFIDKIEVGDSIIKAKDSDGMLLIKKQTHERIELNFADATGYVEYK